MIRRRIHYWLAALASFSWAAPGDAFRHGWVEGGAGACIPLLELSPYLDVVPAYRGTLQFSYWEDWRSELSASYAHLEGERAPYSAHHALGMAGLVWQYKEMPLEAGGGVSLFFARIDSMTVQGNWMLADNETEFGGWLRLGMPWQIGQNGMVLHPWVEYQLAMTEPRSSRFLWMGMGLRWPLW